MYGELLQLFLNLTLQAISYTKSSYMILQYCLMFYIGKLQLRNVILLTSEIEEKWYKLGIALCIPIRKMENFYEKYNKNPMMGLNRVYCYWLNEDNHLMPAWEKLISALKEIKQYTIATTVEQYIKVNLSFTVIN